MSMEPDILFDVSVHVHHHAHFLLKLRDKGRTTILFHAAFLHISSFVIPLVSVSLPAMPDRVLLALLLVNAVKRIP